MRNLYFPSGSELRGYLYASGQVRCLDCDSTVPIRYGQSCSRTELYSTDAPRETTYMCDECGAIVVEALRL